MGEQTQIMKDMIDGYDYGGIEGDEYIQQLDSLIGALSDCHSFIEGIQKQFKMLGVSEETLKDKNKICKSVESFFEKAAIEMPASVKNWIKKEGITPSYDERGRENIYKLCFALKMNEKETAEFFLKSYLDRPFNFKKSRETVYFFCLKTGRSYNTAQNMINTLKTNEQCEEIEIYKNLTKSIGEDIEKCGSEDELLKYITENSKAEVELNKTARDNIQEIINECKDFEEIIKNQKRKIDNIDNLLIAIYGDENSPRQGIRQPKNAKDENYQGYIFPDYVTKHFPQRQMLENILDPTKETTYDAVRKALIILNFYHFFKTEKYVSEEFEEDMNTLLEGCGYGRLYYRNPFDLMIYYCAQHEDPLEEFRNLIKCIKEEHAREDLG